jgi:hypothetical protein
MNPSTKSRAIGASRVVRAWNPARSARVESIRRAASTRTRASARASIDGDG